MTVNFKTPSGLKIRLNHRYFFYQLTKVNRYHTDDEMVQNDTMYNATVNIENRFLIPTALLQVFALFAAVSSVSIPVFCVAAAILYIFGCIYRLLKHDPLLGVAMIFLTSLYQLLRWVCYAALIILAFVCKSTYLILPYIVMRVALYIVSEIINHIVVCITDRKYGIPFNDTEICAFRVFHSFSESKLKYSDYINQYIADMSEIEKR